MLAVQDHYKNPRWSTVLAVLIQMFGYPYVAYKAAAAGGGLQQWLGGGWEVGTEAIFWDRLFFVALFGYMAKDMHCMPDPSMVAHHFLCGGSAVGNLFLSGGARIFMFGTLILEVCKSCVCPAQPRRCRLASSAVSKFLTAPHAPTHSLAHAPST